VSGTVDLVVARLREAGCVFAEDEARLLAAAAATPAGLADLVGRRCAGEPLELVLGWAELCGVRVALSAGVFVPRRRTELLVREAVSLRRGRPATVLLDLCCGTGAVGLAVATELERVELHASDLDPAAVRCARRNVTDGQVHQGDLFDPLPHELRGRVDLLVVNAPYVPSDEVALLPAEAREHEHLMALDGGGDGLDLHRRIGAAAPAWLSPGGRLLIETSSRQAEATVAAVAAGGLRPRVVSDDDLAATVVIGSPAPCLRLD
jgi:release factor glutamine methyltransferase